MIAPFACHASAHVGTGKLQSSMPGVVSSVRAVPVVTGSAAANPVSEGSEHTRVASALRELLVRVEATCAPSLPFG